MLVLTFFIDPWVMPIINEAVVPYFIAIAYQSTSVLVFYLFVNTEVCCQRDYRISKVTPLSPRNIIFFVNILLLNPESNTAPLPQKQQKTIPPKVAGSLKMLLQN